MSILRPQNEPVKWLDFIYLRDALDAAGCPICTLVERACYRQLDNLFYENVSDVGVRLRLYKSKGFCNAHAWMATRIPHTDSGIAIIYGDLLRSVIERTEAQVRQLAAAGSPRRLHRSRRRGRSASVLETTAPCPVCETARFNERVYFGELLKWFDDPELRTAFQRSFGLCLPHLDLAMRGFPDHPHLPELLATEREKLTGLQTELKEFSRKRDDRLANEPKDTDQAARRRAIELFVGKREVFHRDRPRRTKRSALNLVFPREPPASKWLPLYRLRDALDADCCVICALIERESERQMTLLFHEGIMDPGVRLALRRSGGFCNSHGWLAARTPTAPAGLAVVYEELLATVIERSAAVTEPTKPRAKRRASDAPLLYPATANCPMCDWNSSTEYLTLSNLLDFFDDPDFASKYHDSFGICLPHLQMALDESPDHPQLQRLLGAERGRLAALQTELQEFDRKRDYRHANEPKGVEQTSWRRVIEKFVGHREMIGR
ncbi:MAG TPA: DUF6062 family protein [Verrucomicrobiae bacterium]|nr:DUF6062 family protein [Verrucomicrobiae bacterium]